MDFSSSVSRLPFHNRNKVLRNMRTYYIHVVSSLRNDETYKVNNLQTHPVHSLTFGLLLFFCLVYHSYLKYNIDIDVNFKTVL